MRNHILSMAMLALALSSSAAQAQETKAMKYDLHLGVTVRTSAAPVSGYDTSYEGPKKKKKDKDKEAEEPKETIYDSDKDPSKLQAFLKQGEVACVTLSINHFLDSLDAAMVDPTYVAAQKLYRERCVIEPSGKADLVMTFDKELKTGKATFSFYPLAQFLKGSATTNSIPYVSVSPNDEQSYESTVTMSDWGRICTAPDDISLAGRNDYETRQMVSRLSTSITRAAMGCKGQVGVTSETLRAVDAIGVRIQGGIPATTTSDPCGTKDDGRTTEQRQHDCAKK